MRFVTRREGLVGARHSSIERGRAGPDRSPPDTIQSIWQSV